jgi:hypothetical protein
MATNYTKQNDNLLRLVTTTRGDKRRGTRLVRAACHVLLVLGTGGATGRSVRHDLRNAKTLGTRGARRERAAHTKLED